MTILDRLDSNWSREEREKLNNNWTIIESYLSNLQGQINFLTGNVNVQELIDQLKSLLSQGTIILDELKSALINVEEIIEDAQNATNDANDAAQSALNAVNDIQSMLDNFQVRGTYDNDTVYSKNNSVFYEGSSYIYTNNTPNKGNPPPNYPTVANAHWQMTAAKGASGDGAVSKVNGKEPDGAGEVILTASDIGAASAEQLDQLEQTTENHIDNTDKHLQIGERDYWNGFILRKGGLLSGAVNFDTLTPNRIFQVASHEGSTGGPPEAYGILTYLIPPNTDYGVQEFVGMSSRNKYMRTTAGGTWKPWIKILNQIDYDQLFQSVSEGKALQNQALTDMGIYTVPDAPFEVTATNIRKLGGRVVTENVATPAVPNRGDVSVYSTLIDFKPTYAFSDWGGMVYIKDRYIGPTGLLTASPQGGGEMVQAIGVQQIGNQWRVQFALANYSSMTKPASSLNYYIFA